MTKRVMVVGVGAATVIAGALAIVAWVNNIPPPPLETPETLAQQAAAISAHREAQRQTPPVDARPAQVAPPRLPVSASTYWTDFRGPRRDGAYTEQPIRTDWPAPGLRPMWKQPIGGGHASFVIAEGRAFTIEQRGPNEVVVAYDVASGRELWATAWPATFNEYYGGVGPRATPAWNRGTIFALGGTGELRALDAGTGATRWRTNILEDAGAANLEWGMSASPLVVGDTVIVFPGGGSASLAAYDVSTGARRWTALEDDAAYSSPMYATVAGVKQLLVFAADRIVALAPAAPVKELWAFDWATHGGVNVAQPLVIGENRVFLSAGYGMGAVMLEVGRDGDGLSVRELWRTNRMKNQFTSSVYHDGFIYGLDESILACLDAATGELKWKGGRYGYGQVMLASGHLIVVTDTGDLALVRATPERHHEIARFPAISGRTWNHPAMSDGILLVRNASEMAAFDLR